MSKETRPSITELLSDRAAVQAALRRALLVAVRQHVQAGLPMAEGREGEVVWVPAEEVLARLSDESSS